MKPETISPLASRADSRTRRCYAGPAFPLPSPALPWPTRSIRLLFILSAGLLFTHSLAAAEDWSVTSPNGDVRLAVRLADLGGSADYLKSRARLYYRVEQGPAASRATVIGDSPLGLEIAGLDLLDGLQFTSSSQPQPIDDTYTMVRGKRRQCHNRANQVTLAFRNPAGQALEIDLRAYDDGAAFRYRVPGNGSEVRTLTAEATGFALPADARLWMAPSDKPSTYSPAYETYYENEIPAGTVSPSGKGWSFPVLFRTGDSRHWGLITEANLGTGFCATRLSSTALGGVYRIALPDPEEGHGTGSVNPMAQLPWEMPWRVFILGSSLANIVESTLVTDLSAPSQIENPDWIRPGRVAWSWWSDPPSPQDGEKQKRFVDLAAAMGWEYMLVDANWTIMDNGNIHDVIRYAQSKGIGVLLWYNSGGPHNVVTEKPRGNLAAPELRRFEFDLLRKWGVKGVKVDFFQSDKQNVIQLYQDILRDAAAAGILVDFHGCTLPRGWSRTWPNLMSMEAVRGEECYIFDPQFPDRAPVQNTILPFTRNTVGPMDYTPVGFSNNRYPHRTTWAHELALAVLFETGLLHFTDKAEAYLTLPDAPKQFLRNVPVTWDDTRFVAGYPGQFAILARRKGDTWYLAGVNGGKEAREERVRLGSWLGTGSFTMERIGDGADGRSFSNETQSVVADREFVVKLHPFGGFVATLKPAR